MFVPLNNITLKPIPLKDFAKSFTIVGTYQNATPSKDGYYPKIERKEIPVTECKNLSWIKNIDDESTKNDVQNAICLKRGDLRLYRNTEIDMSFVIIDLFPCLSNCDNKYDVNDVYFSTYLYEGTINVKEYKKPISRKHRLLETERFQEETMSSINFNIETKTLSTLTGAILPNTIVPPSYAEKNIRNL